jgi:predicted lipoprotein with Yx(FWY)xxD motif
VRYSSVSAAAALALVALAAAGCGSSTSSSNNSNATNAANSGSRYGSVSSSTAAASSASSAPSASSGASSAPAPSSGSAVVVSTKQGKLGTVLAAGGKHLTVYMFEGDRGASSSCVGACAHVWPPVITSGAPMASGEAVAGDLGTITRHDGTMQVTYKGHPLYWFARDGDTSDAYGQGVMGFGASWYVLSPTGSKVDKS